MRDAHLFSVLWMIGIVLLVSWLVGAWAVPQAGVWRHLPLLLALVALGSALRRRRTSPGAQGP